MSAGVHACTGRMCHSETDRKCDQGDVNDVMHRKRHAPEACAEDLGDLRKVS